MKFFYLLPALFLLPTAQAEEFLCLSRQELKQEQEDVKNALHFHSQEASKQQPAAAAKIREIVSSAYENYRDRIVKPREALCKERKRLNHRKEAKFEEGQCSSILAAKQIGNAYTKEQEDFAKSLADVYNRNKDGATRYRQEHYRAIVPLNGFFPKQEDQNRLRVIFEEAANFWATTAKDKKSLFLQLNEGFNQELTVTTARLNELRRQDAELSASVQKMDCANQTAATKTPKIEKTASTISGENPATPPAQDPPTPAAAAREGTVVEDRLVPSEDPTPLPTAKAPTEVAEQSPAPTGPMPKSKPGTAPATASVMPKARPSTEQKTPLPLAKPTTPTPLAKPTTPTPLAKPAPAAAAPAPTTVARPVSDRSSIIRPTAAPKPASTLPTATKPTAAQPAATVPKSTTQASAPAPAAASVPSTASRDLYCLQVYRGNSAKIQACRTGQRK